MPEERNWGADGKMNNEQFVEFIGAILKEKKDDLPDVARTFEQEQGRGAIYLNYIDAEKPKDRRMGISYLTPDDLPPHTYLHQLVREYDTEWEAVVYAKCGNFQTVRHIQFPRPA